MKTSNLTLSVLLIASGCAAPISYKWVKPGGSQQEFNVANYECMKESQQRVSASDLTYNPLIGGYQSSSENKIITNQNLQRACMNARGWTLTRQDEQQFNSLFSEDETALITARRQCMETLNDNYSAARDDSCMLSKGWRFRDGKYSKP